MRAFTTNKYGTFAVSPIASPRSPLMQTCQYCGKQFKPKVKDRIKFCSRECGWAGYKRAHPKVVEPKVPNRCEVCCVEFNGRVTKKTCSDECKKTRERKCAADSFRKQFRSVRETNPFVERICAHCGSEFRTNFLVKHRLYCSKQCMNRAAKQQRRNWKRAGRPTDAIFIYRSRIFDRDGWRCRICMKKVNKKLKAPHPMSASLDHIVPLSKGGKHEPLNVQLAHFMCNSIKSANLGVQLRLVG